MRIVLIGPPGCDDSSWADRLAERFHLLSLSVPELVRGAITDGTPAGQQAREEQQNNGGVSDETMVDILLERIEQPDAASGFVLHSWPRTLKQAELLDHGLHKAGKPLHGVIQLEVDLDIMLQRITGRRVCTSCGYVHNVFTNPPSMDGQCDMCGGNLRHRADDREETFETRMRFFEQNTIPVIEYYRQTERLQAVHVVGDPDHVFDVIAGIASDMGSQEPKVVVTQIEPKVTMRELEAKVFGGFGLGDMGIADETDLVGMADDDIVPPVEDTDSVVETEKPVVTKKKTAARAKTGKKVTVKKVVTKKGKATGGVTKKAVSKKSATGKGTKRKITVKKAASSKTKKKTTTKKGSASKRTGKTVAKKTATKRKTVKQAASKKVTKKTTARKTAVKKAARKPAASSKKTTGKKAASRKKR